MDFNHSQNWAACYVYLPSDNRKCRPPKQQILAEVRSHMGQGCAEYNTIPCPSPSFLYCTYIFNFLTCLYIYLVYSFSIFATGPSSSAPPCPLFPLTFSHALSLAGACTVRCPTFLRLGDQNHISVVPIGRISSHPISSVPNLELTQLS
jgi:hypothetical protein